MVDELRIELTDARNAEFDAAFERLNELIDLSDADEIYPRRENAVYTACVVLWMLIFQRLKPDASLEAAVKHLIQTRPDYLPQNRRISEGTLSKSTAAYSQARSDLPLEVVQWFAGQVSQAIVTECDRLLCGSTLEGRRVFLLDGTTMKLAPEKELQAAFPPASNQFGEGVWPIALLTVFHELSSGCALLPEIGAMYGPNAVSETKLARQGMEKLPEKSLVMTDAGFGIFGVAYQAKLCGHDFLLRMKKANFQSLCRKATLISQSKHCKTYSHKWTPTAHNRKTQPDLADDAAVDVMLHEVTVNDQLTLYLVTSLKDDGHTLAELYKHRVEVEIDIRNLKVVMDTENIRAKKVDTFKKELYTSVVAYNLVSQFRRQAAELENVPPRRMSFKGTWTTFQTFLLRHLHTDAEQWRAAFNRAMYYATKDKLPNRPGRTAKRVAYRKRPKDCQFDKRQKPPSKLNQNDLN